MSTVTKAVEILLTASNTASTSTSLDIKPENAMNLLTGKVAELHEDHVTFAEQPAYVDENTGKNIEMFWSLGYA